MQGPVYQFPSHPGKEGLDFLDAPSQKPGKQRKGIRLHPLDHVDLLVAADVL